MFGRVNQRIISTTPTQNISYDNSNTMLYNNVKSGFMRMKYVRDPTSIPSEPIPKINMIDTNLVKSTETMKWGKPTWFLLHTLAEKVDSVKFIEIRKQFLDIIYSICSNLPCPDCANHAKTYLDGINFNTIYTKEDLKNMLFMFHNTVNQRKGYEIFSREELDIKYSTAITVNIINNFMVHYLKKNAAPKMIANDMFRRRIIQNVQEWLIKNKEFFVN